MKRVKSMLLSLLLVSALALNVAAQDGPRPPRPDDRRDAPLPPPQPGGRPMDPGRMMEGPRPPMDPRLDMMRGYLDLVDRFARLSRDPTTSGVAAVIAAADLLKARGADAGIEYFTQQLEAAKNDAVKRAIRIQLIELYKQSGQHDKAMEQLTELIHGAPAGGGGAEQPAR